MNTEHPITPSLELLKHWEDQHFDEGENYDVMLIQAYQAGADQQLEQAAKWLDHNALNEAHLKIAPMGDALKEAMRPKPPSLKDQSLALIDKIQSNKEMWQTDDLDVVRRALESLPD